MYFDNCSTIYKIKFFDQKFDVIDVNGIYVLKLTSSIKYINNDKNVLINKFDNNEKRFVDACNLIGTSIRIHKSENKHIINAIYLPSCQEDQLKDIIMFESLGPFGHFNYKYILSMNLLTGDSMISYYVNDYQKDKALTNYNENISNTNLFSAIIKRTRQNLFGVVREEMYLGLDTILMFCNDLQNPINYDSIKKLFD